MARWITLWITRVSQGKKPLEINYLQKWRWTHQPHPGCCLRWPGHGVKLPFDQATSRSFDAGIGDRHHELAQLIRGQCCHVFLFWFLEDRADAAEREEYYNGEDPQTFFSARVECQARPGSTDFFQPEPGDLLAVTEADGRVQMYYLYESFEDDDGWQCVLIREDEVLA